MIRRYLLSLVALLWLADGPAWGQVIGVGTYAQQSALITTVATNNWVVPANVTVVYVDACASGGGGGGGGTTTSNAGGGGGGDRSGAEFVGHRVAGDDFVAECLKAG